MMLCDTAPLIAMVDRDDQWHTRTMGVLAKIRPTAFVTTWPCLTEAMHFLRRSGGFPAQERLWNLLETGALQLHIADDEEPPRMHGLMRKFADAPMDLADASLVTAAEALGVHRVFTFDRHFHAYRSVDGELEVVA